jgi:hypothetical protein
MGKVYDRRWEGRRGGGGGGDFGWVLIMEMLSPTPVFLLYFAEVAEE